MASTHRPSSVCKARFRSFHIVCRCVFACLDSRMRPNNHLHPALSPKRKLDPSMCLPLPVPVHLPRRLRKTPGQMPQPPSLNQSRNLGPGRGGSGCADCGRHSRTETRASAPATPAPAGVAILLAQGSRSPHQGDAHQAPPNHPAISEPASTS